MSEEVKEEAQIDPQATAMPEASAPDLTVQDLNALRLSSMLLVNVVHLSQTRWLQ